MTDARISCYSKASKMKQVRQEDNKAKDEERNRVILVVPSHAWKLMDEMDEKGQDINGVAPVRLNPNYASHLCHYLQDKGINHQDQPLTRLLF